MKSIYMDIVKQNMLMTTELIKLSNLLDDNGIQFMAIKGPTLSQLAYGDVISRQYVDLDILVEEKNLYLATKILVKQNYSTSHSIDLLKNKNYCILDNDFSIYSPNKSTHIELHWRLFRKKISSNIGFNDYYNSKLNVLLNQNSISTLSLENLLVYLCIHGAKHSWERIEWLNDINFLIENNYNKINWNIVINISERMKSKIALLLGLNIINDLYNTTLPPEILEEINTDSIVELRNVIFYFLENSPENKENYFSQFKIMLFQIKLFEDNQQKISYILNSYFSITRNDYFFLPLPSYLNLLYYLIKPFRLIYKSLFPNK